MCALTTTRPPYDADLEPIVAAIMEQAQPLTTENLEAVREAARDGIPGQEATDFTVGGSVLVKDLRIPGPTGAPDVAVTVLSPADPRPGLTGILHIHGGGMVAGTRMFGLEDYLPYVAEGDAVVVTVDYRLAPEHPDPAPVEDTYAALVWMARAATELGIDERRLIVAGRSAGAGLAAGTVLKARDQGHPYIAHQVLDSPMLDDRMQTSSSQMLDGDGPWDRNDNLFGWTALLGERRGGPGVSPYAAPARATDLTGLPRTYLSVGTADIFRDETVAYAQRLSEAGILVDLHLWGGGFHGYDLVVPDAPISRATSNARDEFMRRAIRR
ncbi:alpha/beta hydrolase [Streptomyces sp. NPDC047841]|uniref:alpha/beta hydrolase n=1 Tax=Streptomyces sp. NPDC047841 TaxID=3154708 RepID=UPI003456382E